MNLEQCRAEIDRIDRELLKLFSARMEVVKHVATYKKERDMEIFHPVREEAIIADRVARAPEEFKPYVKPFFTHLMEYSKCMQLRQICEEEGWNYEEASLQDTRETKVVYQGIAGAYQQLAAKEMFSNATISAVATFSEVFEQVSSGAVDYGVLPLENSTAGTIGDVYDLLIRYELHINFIHRLQIRHCLMTKPTTSFAEITDIYTHPQSILQCKNALASLQIPAHPVANNAVAAQMVSASTEPIAAICAKECAELYQLNIHKEDLQDSDHNYTRFIVISKHLCVPSEAVETTVCLRLPNHKNELNKLLTKFSIYGIDLTKIESRPIGDKEFNVTFYISFEGTLRDPQVRDLLQDLSYHYEWFRLLGCYPKN